jgi:hypothetical protein
LFSPGTLVSSTNKTDRHDITEILLKVALNTITHPRLLHCSIKLIVCLIYNIQSILILSNGPFIFIRNIRQIAYSAWTTFSIGNDIFKLQVSMFNCIFIYQIHRTYVYNYINILSSDSSYSAKLLDAAKSLYAFAKAHPGVYSNSVPQAKNFYG